MIIFITMFAGSFLGVLAGALLAYWFKRRRERIEYLKTIHEWMKGQNK